MSKSPPALLECYDDLAASLDHAWHVLEEATRNRRSGFRTLAVATNDPMGRPNIRTVVLRACDRGENYLTFNTDRRSPKMAEIAADPRAMIHGYDAAQKLQLRIGCQLAIADEAFRAMRWEKTAAMSRECYHVAAVPSAQIETPDHIVFDANASNGGYTHFQPIIAHIETIEWLYLAAQGHRRARFTRAGGATPWEMTWLVP